MRGQPTRAHCPERWRSADVRRLRHPRARSRRRPPRLLRALRAPAPRAGECGHRGQRRPSRAHRARHGARRPGLRRGQAAGPARARGHRACPLLDDGLGALDELAADRRPPLMAHHPGTLAEGAVHAMERIRGAFSAVVLSEDTLLAFRDPDGIRPLVLGDLDGSPVVGSETPALDIIGASVVRELKPGELLICDSQGSRVEQAVAPRRRETMCVFEHIYFARPDAQMDGQTLHAERERMGERLALEAPADADVVIAVPDSGTPAAQGYARASGLPFRDGLIKNRYVGRTFIQPDQALREHGVRLKFNPLPHAIAGKRLVVVDDSIVRGSTTRKIVEMLRDA